MRATFLEEIEEDVKRTLEIMAPDGGYVFVPSHNVQADVSPDRFYRAYESALRHRDYQPA
jgi:uroporphyrinogen decarboxylase